MLGVLAVTDFRNTETWMEARFLVCALLEFAELWSHQLKYRRQAKEVGRLSVGLLDEIAQGYDPKGRRLHLSRARQSIDILERTLQQMQQQGALETSEALRLKTSLETVNESLATLER